MKTKTKRIAFKNATKRRVQALTTDEFDRWRELTDLLVKLPTATDGNYELARVTVHGIEWEKYWGRRGPVWVAWVDHKMNERDVLDVAYNVLIDPDAKVERWESGEFYPVPLPA